MCNKLEIGTRYISKCLPVSQSLVTHNLNFWINNTKSRELMLRTVEGHDINRVRAIMTNRYKRIDNDVIATKAINPDIHLNKCKPGLLV